MFPVLKNEAQPHYPWGSNYNYFHVYFRTTKESCTSL